MATRNKRIINMNLDIFLSLAKLQLQTEMRNNDSMDIGRHEARAGKKMQLQVRHFHPDMTKIKCYGRGIEQIERRASE